AIPCERPIASRARGEGPYGFSLESRRTVPAGSPVCGREVGSAAAPASLERAEIDANSGAAKTAPTAVPRARAKFRRDRVKPAMVPSLMVSCETMAKPRPGRPVRSMTEKAGWRGRERAPGDSDGAAGRN